MKIELAVLGGDGIGPEVVAEGVKVLEVVGKRYGHQFAFKYADFGGISIDRHGEALTDAALEMCRGCGAVLMGAVGGPKWDDPRAPVRPEQGLLKIRKGLGLFANLRPVKVFPMLMGASPLKRELLEGVDFVVVRELTGGLYFGKPKRRWQTRSGWRGVDTLFYTEQEIERILRVGFELAQQRRRKLTSVDKANILETSRLWRQMATDMAAQYPDVELRHILVDACAMRLVQRPAEFDVIVTENMFGDILTDEAAVLTGSMGMLPSASLAGVPRPGQTAFGLYEPIHGTAPDIAGQGIANPLATLLSVAMMLRHSFGLEAEARAVEAAVLKVLEAGYRTRDIMEPRKEELSTVEMGRRVVEGL